MSGGGPVIDLGVHVIDHTRYLMGNPKPVSVYAATFQQLGNRPWLKNGVEWHPKDAKEDDPFNVEDLATALIRYDNGAVTLLETSYSLNGASATQKVLYGDKGGISLAGEPKIYTTMNGYLADITPKMDFLVSVRPAPTRPQMPRISPLCSFMFTSLKVPFREKFFASKTTSSEGVTTRWG